MKKLSNREKEVMDLMIKGMSNNEIAEELFISIHTVKAHLASSYEKLGTANRVLGAIRYFELCKKSEQMQLSEK